MQLPQQKTADGKKRITVLPTICSDPKFNFPLQIISKLKGQRWKDGVDEEVQIGDYKICRKNFGGFKARYRLEPIPVKSI